MSDFYHDGMRRLQAEAGSQALASILEKGARHDVLTDAEVRRICEAEFFFIASCFDGRPDVSFKAGAKGFVNVPSTNVIEFPDYNGNYMFRTLGNITENPWVQLLFISFDGRSNRLRINGKATIIKDYASVSAHIEGQALVRIQCTDAFPNCPRYIPNLPERCPSCDIPKDGERQPIPDWKRFPFLAPALPADDPHRAEALASPLMPPGQANPSLVPSARIDPERAS